MNPGNHKKDPYYNSLTRKMILTVISVSFTPMILVSGAILYQFHVSYHEKVRAHLEELVQKHKQNIDYFLNEKLGEIRFLVEDSGFENLRKKSYLEQQLAILQQDGLKRPSKVNILSVTFSWACGVCLTLSLR